MWQYSWGFLISPIILEPTDALEGIIHSILYLLESPN